MSSNQQKGEHKVRPYLSMDAHKLSIKLFAADDTFAPAEFVPIFHGWIQRQALADHLLIDVADYAHVPAGPGTLVVSSEANVHMDRTGDRLGLLYVRKLPFAGAPAAAFRDRLRGTLVEALRAAALMESEPALAGRLTFRTDEVVLRVHDRLLAPNTPETFAAVRGDVEAVFAEVVGGPVTLDYQPSPLTLFEVRVKGRASPRVAELAERAGATAAA